MHKKESVYGKMTGGLPEIWISGGQMSGEDDDTDAGSSVQI